MIKLEESRSYKIVTSHGWIMFNASEVEDGVKCTPINLIEYSYEETLEQYQLTFDIDKPSYKGMTIDISKFFKDVISIDQLTGKELYDYHSLIYQMYNFTLNNNI